MEPSHSDSIDLFISYTGVDRPWAVWIAWQLKEAGYSVRLQAWDFHAGSNFVAEMQSAAERARRTIAVLSPDYLKSAFAAAEWQAALADDPEGRQRKLIPVRVRPCEPSGLLRAIVFADLVGLERAAARETLLGAIRGDNRPNVEPIFPGADSSPPVEAEPEFPGQQSTLNLSQVSHGAPSASPERHVQPTSDMESLAKAYDSATIVYCRLLLLKQEDVTVQQIAYCVQSLRDLVNEALGRTENGESHSSVYGRFIVVPSNTSQAIDLAESLLVAAAEKQFAIAIGVAQGRVERTSDLQDENLVGNPINEAARLAHVQDSPRILIARRVARKVRETSNKYGQKIAPQVHRGKVKRTELEYQLHTVESPTVGETPELDLPSHEMYIVAVDIAGFSDKPLRDQVQQVEALLRHDSRRAMQSVGGTASSGHRRLYAPGGDGGVILFRDGEARVAWTFAKDLRAYCRGNTEVRIGIASGLVVELDNDYPVGRAILQADALSAEPDSGEICCSCDYWDHALESENKQGWNTDRLPKRDAVLLFDRPVPRRAGVVPFQPLTTVEIEENLRESLDAVTGDVCRRELASLIGDDELWRRPEFAATVAKNLVATESRELFDILLGQLMRIRQQSTPDDVPWIHRIEDRFMQAHFDPEKLAKTVEKLADRNAVVLEGVFVGALEAEVGMSRVQRQTPSYDPKGRKILGSKDGEQRTRPAGRALLSLAPKPLDCGGPAATVCLILRDIAGQLGLETDEREELQPQSEKRIPELCNLIRGSLRRRSAELNRILYCAVNLSSHPAARDATVDLLSKNCASLNRWVGDKLFGVVFLELLTDPASRDRENVYVQSIRPRIYDA